MDMLSRFRFFWILVIFGLVLHESAAQMRPPDFQKFIQDRCYHLSEVGEELVYGQEYPLAQTLENFLNLVEKLELANPDRSMVDVAAILLRNYTVENMLKADGGLAVAPPPPGAVIATIQEYWDKKLHDKMQSQQLNMDNPFEDHEICSLYFMMSHTVNDTAWPNEPSYSYVKDGTNGKAKSEVKKTSNPREQGVVTIDMRDYAVALGRVVTGIYLGLANKDEKEALSSLVSRYIQKDLEEKLRNTPVDSLYVLTLGDMLALSTWNLESPKKMGENGKWYSVYSKPSTVGGISTTDICPNVYKLLENATSAYTYSLLRGGVDGIILGNVVQDPNLSSARLSQILRMYYSERGIPIQNGVQNGQHVSVCDRYELIKSYSEVINKELINAVYILTQGFNSDMESRRIKAATENYEQLVNSAIVVKEDFQFCTPTPQRTMQDLPCDTPSDVIAVIDTSNAFFDKQQLILGHLANYLKLWHAGSKMTVLLDKRNGSTGLGLEELLPETTCSSCAACYITQQNIEQADSQNEDFVIQSIDQLLADKKEAESKLYGVAGKVVIYFNYASEEPLTYELNKAIRDLHLHHLDTTIIAVGKNLDVLSKYARKDTKNALLGVDEDLKGLAKTLADQICAKPAMLQYDDCINARDENRAAYDGLITPNTKQHWAMDAEYFIRSQGVKFVVEATADGDVQVCHNRASLPEAYENNCKQTNSTHRHVDFSHTNPCQRYNVVTCGSMLFSIAGLEPKNGQNRERRLCEDEDDDKCKRLDQIKFKISHEGIRCGCSGLSSTLSTLAISFMVVYYMFTKNAQY